MSYVCLLVLFLAVSRRSYASISIDTAEEFPSMDFSDIIEETEDDVTQDPPAVALTFDRLQLPQQFVASAPSAIPQIEIPTGMHIPFLAPGSLLSSLLPYNTIPFFNNQLARTELYNAVSDFSRENGHLSETDASFDAPQVVPVASAPVPAVPAVAPTPSVVPNPKFPTLLNASVQQKLFARKLAARRKLVKNIKLKEK